MRRGKVALTLIASILWSVGFFVSPSHGKLIVGLSSVNVAFLPVYVTEDRGFFKDEGWTCCWFFSTPAQPIFRHSLGETSK